MSSGEPGHVRAHYERWPFPGCDFAGREGLLILRSLTGLLGAHRSARVLDAGCGTGHTTLALARRFPEITFVGVDFSDSSICAARKAAGDLANVSFERADISEDLPGLGLFEVALCFGVLHHTPDMGAALRLVVGRIAPGGRLLLWLYGRHGRARHRLNQAFIQSLCGGAPATEQFRVAREFLEHLGQDHASDSGFYSPCGSGEAGIAWLLDHPEWLADQMIPAHEQDVSMHEILDLFASCELHFLDWLGVSSDLGSYTSSRELVQRFETLSGRQKLLAIDCLIKPGSYLVQGEKR